MSGFKGTSGPWPRDYAGNGNVWASNCKVADTASPVQEWRYRDVPDAERAANARLIAAAPDLLEALEQAVQCIDPDVYSSEYIAARNAIAKAIQS